MTSYRPKCPNNEPILMTRDYEWRLLEQVEHILSYRYSPVKIYLD